jgi:N6-L-threonylcarbamoyladenine synthase
MPTLVLGIETTCDETAAALVERQSDGSGKILSNVVRSQTEEHAAFGGVVPEIAARAHVDLLDGIVDSAMKQAGVGFAQLSAVAAAAGPGLIGGVIVGLTTAKAIAMVHDTPLIAVNHLEAHALTPRLTCALAFPYCLFLASGGHTQIGASAPPSMTPWAKPSTRWQRCSLCPIRADRKSSAPLPAAIQSGLPCHGRCSGAPTPISRCRD